MPGLRALPLGTYPPFNRTTADLIRDADTHLETFKALLLGHSWDLMHAHSATLAGAADFLLGHMTTKTDLFDSWGSYLSERDTGFKTVLTNLSSDTTPEADAMRAAMLTDLESLLGSAAAAKNFLATLMAGQGALFQTRATYKSALHDELDLLASRQIQLTAISLRAAVDSSEFKARTDIATRGLGPAHDADTDTVTAEVQALMAVHDTTVHELYEALHTGVERGAFSDLCEARLGTITRRTPTGALILGGYLGLIQPNPTATIPSGQAAAALALADAVLRLRLLHAYLSTARAYLAVLDPDRWYSSEKRRTDTRQEDTLVPHGTPHTVDDILAGGVPDATLVRLEGYVDTLVIEDDPAPPKFSSFFELKDHTTGAGIRIRAHMFSLANNGLSNGSRTILHGYVRAAVPWTTGPGIDIDRVNLGELRKTSWYDDMTARMTHQVQLYQDGMNMTATTSELGS